MCYEKDGIFANGCTLRTAQSPFLNRICLKRENPSTGNWLIFRSGQINFNAKPSFVSATTLIFSQKVSRLVVSCHALMSDIRLADYNIMNIMLRYSPLVKILKIDQQRGSYFIICFRKYSSLWIRCVNLFLHFLYLSVPLSHKKQYRCLSLSLFIRSGTNCTAMNK